jgi:hypothetical protein
VLKEDIDDDTDDRHLMAAYDDRMSVYYRDRSGGSKDTG